MKRSALRWSGPVAGTLIVSMILAGTLQPGPPLDEAEIIFFNGDVITLEDQGVVQAIAIRGDTILAVGSNVDMLIEISKSWSFLLVALKCWVERQWDIRDEPETA